VIPRVTQVSLWRKSHLGASHQSKIHATLGTYPEKYRKSAPMRGFTRARGARETSKAAHRPQNGAWFAAELRRGDENGSDQRTDPPHLHQAKGSLITATSVTIFRSSACSRKSLRASLHRKLKIEDWLADGAVSCEPVSASNSLISREDTGNFRDLGPHGADLRPKKPCPLGGLRRNSLLNGTGNYFGGIGNFLGLTGNSISR
jgi:hypothetical protein